MNESYLHLLNEYAKAALPAVIEKQSSSYFATRYTEFSKLVTETSFAIAEDMLEEYKKYQYGEKKF